MYKPKTKHNKTITTNTGLSPLRAVAWVLAESEKTNNMIPVREMNSANRKNSPGWRESGMRARGGARERWMGAESAKMDLP